MLFLKEKIIWILEEMKQPELFETVFDPLTILKYFKQILKQVSPWLLKILGFRTSWSRITYIHPVLIQESRKYQKTWQNLNSIRISPAIHHCAENPSKAYEEDLCTCLHIFMHALKRNKESVWVDRFTMDCFKQNIFLRNSEPKRQKRS